MSHHISEVSPHYVEKLHMQTCDYCYYKFVYLQVMQCDELLPCSNYRVHADI